MNSGAILRRDHRDYSFFKTKGIKFGDVSFADNYSVDAQLWLPNQELPSTLFNPNTPALPFGCTDYANNELAIDEDKQLYNPEYIESFTHANANQGGDPRKALQSIVQNGLQDQNGNIIKGRHDAYLNVQSANAIDAFDSVRLAMLSSSAQNRGVSIASYYWHEFNSVGLTGIYQTPTYDTEFASEHNWVVKGWKTINGVTYLICQMLQGINYGDKGFSYMSREIFNATMSYNGLAFVLDKLEPGQTPQPVDMNIIAWIVSYIRQLFNV